MRADGPLTRILASVGGFLVRVPWPFVAVMWLGWAAVIFDLSSKRRPIVTSDRPLWEFLSNLAHAPLFGLLALFAAALLLRQKEGGWPRWRAGRATAVVALTMAYGLADEWHQSTVPGRHASAMDVVTDTVAAAMVMWVVHGVGVGERAVRWRLVVGVVVCVASAWAAGL